MMTKTFELRFAGKKDVQLVETIFGGFFQQQPRTSVRGKTAGACKGSGSFQWTAAVRALSILIVRTTIADLEKNADNQPTIAGARGTLAASLDFAMSKQPNWVREMFGVDASGDSYVRRLLIRSNPERKRPGPVIIGVNEKIMHPSELAVAWNGELLTTPAKLRELLAAIEKVKSKPQPQPVNNFRLVVG